MSDRSDSIEIEVYQPLWLQKAIAEIQLIQNFNLPFIRDIQHVGSTAVPGLMSKPVIDIYIGVDDIEFAKKLIIDPIKSLGYQFWDENPNLEKMFFVKGMPPFGKKRTHHIHVVKFMSDYWEARILFRDFLIREPGWADDYGELKINLAATFADDREKYTDGKYEFITRALQAAGFKKHVRR